MDVREYLTADGKNPYREWLDTLDIMPRARIQARVLRFSTGNLGDHKSVGGGVWEARVMFGPGYRIYFGKDGAQLVLLLLGGDKSTQTVDVAQGAGVMAVVSGGQTPWQDEVKTGTSDSRRTFATQYSPASSCWRRSTKVSICSLRSGR